MAKLGYTVSEKVAKGMFVMIAVVGLILLALRLLELL